MPQLEPLYFLNSISWTYLIFVINFVLISKIFLPLNLRTLLIRLTLIAG
uniref:ATP synthase protein 8 n=1 Tax=Blastocladiella emersonii TaxID=4808 RepID=B6A7S4_BLAEM|nr:ATP synthase F0 subunit 8 [Blastocladiella emersonii]ABB78015.1 ATP synthase F0 subunit 8 [Blastocladiella emersonii]